MNATIGLIRALFTYDKSVVKIGTAAFKSRNLRSISMITHGSPSPKSSTPCSGALSGGLANSRRPGILSKNGLLWEDKEVEMTPAMSSRRALKGKSWWGSRGNLMSKTASTLPDVIQDMGPSFEVLP